MRGHFLFTLTSYAMMCTFFVPDNRDLALKQRQTAVFDSVFFSRHRITERKGMRLF